MTGGAFRAAITRLVTRTDPKLDDESRKPTLEEALPMTSTTHPRHADDAQPTVPVGALRRVAAMPARFGRWLGAGTSKFRASSQLGPSVEQEVGRSTGGRI